MTGTAVGVISLVGYTPDIFLMPIAGWLIDRSPGPEGHQDFFTLMLGVALLGFGILVLDSIDRRKRMNNAYPLIPLFPGEFACVANCYYICESRRFERETIGRNFGTISPTLWRHEITEDIRCVRIGNDWIVGVNAHREKNIFFAFWRREDV